MNETLKTIAERFSCRAYSDTPVSDEQVKAIATAALQAPSARDMQRWQIIAIRDRALIQEIEDEGMNALKNMPDQSAYNSILSRGGKLLYNAPCVFVVAVEQADLPGCSLDGGIVIQNIALAASSLGLGNVICLMSRLAFSSPKAAYFKEKLGFKPGYDFCCSVLIGHGEMTKEPHAIDSAKVNYIG